MLFLDEPTIGLDAVSKLAVRDFIKRLNGEHGVTVILTTHDMDDIEALCTRIMVIGHGRLLSDGPLEDLRARVTTERRLIVDLVEEDAQITDPDVTVTHREGHRVFLRFNPERVSTAALIGRITTNHTIRDLFDRFGSLRDWSLPEVALLYGIVNVAFAITDAMARGFDMVPQYIKSGDFDRMLLRPRTTALQLLGKELTLRRIGRFSQGLAVLIWAAYALQISWTPEKLVLLCGTIAGAACFFMALLSSRARWRSGQLRRWKS